MTNRAARLAEAIARDFYGEQGLDFPESVRTDVPRKWEETKEYALVQELRESDVDNRTLRLFLTFVAAMSRDRAFGDLLDAAATLLKREPKLFEPAEAARMPLATLRDRLQTSKVSRKHDPDSKAWRTIARSLTEPGPVAVTISDGKGDASRLLREMDSLAKGEVRFPLLRGEKTAPLWLGWLAALGCTELKNLDRVPIAVDTHIRRVSKGLGVVDAHDARDSVVDPAIRAAWLDGVEEAEVRGPAGAAGTCAALNSPLWLLGKHGWKRYKRRAHR